MSSYVQESTESWKMRRVDDAEEYRKRAERCLQVAVELADTSQKLIALDMATAWLRLAEQAAKNGATDAVYATPGVPLPESPTAR